MTKKVPSRLSKRYQESQLIFSIAVILAFYSFGTFGFFNIFGFAWIPKIVVIFFCIFGVDAIIGSRLWTYQPKLFWIICLFFAYHGIMMTYIKGDIFIGAIQSIVMLIIALFILIVSKKNIRLILDSIIVSIFIFSVGGAVVFLVYAFDPSQLSSESRSVFDSGIGSADVTVKSSWDYLSFSSGGSYSLFGHAVTRVKGYSNEPSSTLVHYLAPAVFCFILAGKYKIIGLFLLLFSFFSISSLVSILSILGAFFIYVLFSIINKLFVKYLLLLFIGMTMIAMYVSEELVSNLLLIGRSLNTATFYDLLAKKEGSAIIRLQSYVDGVNFILQNPLGGSNYTTMTGLWTQIGLIGGGVLLSMYFIFTKKVLALALNAFSHMTSKSKMFGVALMVSIYLTTFLISGYGWGRIPGVIIFFLFFRLLSDRGIWNNSKFSDYPHR
jgi:hypothetical protein